MNIYKTLYGLLRRTLLFKKPVSDLESYGFIINPYNPCVANTEINRSQMVVVCHVDDLNVSRKDYFEVTRITV